MKAATMIFILLLLTVTAWAQDDDLPPIRDGKAREKIQAARVAYLTDQLALTPEEAEKFWPIYREFSEKRKLLLKEYREVKRNPDPTKTAEQNDTELVDLGFKLKQEELDLEKNYSARFLKVISAQKLKTLPEAEKRFRQMVLNQIQQRRGQRGK